MLPRKGDKHTFKFFKDGGGRLRATWVQVGVTKPVVSTNGKRYTVIAKLFGLEKLLSNDDLWNLQLAGDGDEIMVEII